VNAETRLLARLDRIERLDRAHAPAGTLLEEVRALLADAEAWVAARPPGAELAADALDRCREAIASREAIAMM
jgi:hypothetical protein